MPSTATDRIDGLTTSVAIKAPCRVATTANITLSGLQTIDGVTVVADDRVLVKNQTSAAENGIWVAQSTAWSRARDFNGARDAVQGTLVAIHSGTQYARTIWQVSTVNPIYIGTTEISFVVANDVALTQALAASTGSALVGHIAAGVGATARTVQAKLRDTVNVKDFGAVGDGLTNDSAAVQAAQDTLIENSVLVFPPGHYVIEDQITVNTDGVTWMGYGAKLTIGANEAAGVRHILVDANNFAAHGFHIVDSGTKVAAFGVVPATATVSGFAFTDMVIDDCFYAVRLDGQSGILIKDAVIHNIRSTAPGGGLAAGHIFGDFCDNVTVSQCIARLGTNSSQIGFADSANISIVGNHCLENEDLDSADCSIEIEDSPNANAVIVGNVCDHDIWVDDSTHVTIGPNIASWLRFTITDRDNTNINCAGGVYHRINAQGIGTPGAFRTSANFANVTLDPAGNTEAYAINASGTYVGEMKFRGVQVTSNGSTANLNITRNASAIYRFRDCDFNGGTVTISDSGGTVSLRDCEDYVTENSGNGTITSGSTSVVITHGLSRTPALQDVIITGGENPTNDVGTIWVSTLTSTQFTVNCEADPGASNFDFGWKAIITRSL